MANDVDAIDRTVNKTNEWLAAISACLGEQKDRKRAYVALRSVLHALRDRLPLELAASFGAQLPLLIRGIYYEGWHPHGKPLKVRKQEDFLNLVSREYRSDLDLDADEAARAVFSVILQHLDPGESEKIIRVLPPPIAELWSPSGSTRALG